MIMSEIKLLIKIYCNKQAKNSTLWTMSWTNWPEFGEVQLTVHVPNILHQKEYLLCFENSFDWLCEKKLFLVIKRKISKFEAEGQEFLKILRSLQQFIQTVKWQNDFSNRILFNYTKERFFGQEELKCTSSEQKNGL